MDPARNQNGKWLRRAAWLLVVPGCYLAYLLGTAFGPVQSKSSPTASAATAIRLANGLEVEATDLDLGEVWEHPEFVRPVTVTNRGTADAVVTNLSGGCECTAIEPTSFTLAPGQSKSVNVKIDLTHRFPHQFGMDRRELAVTVHPTLAHRGLSAEPWKLTGVIKSRVSLESRGLGFADLCGQGGPPVTLKMRVTTHVPLARIEAAIPAGAGTVQVRRTEGREDHHEILVTPNPHRPLGTFRFEVAVTATTPDGLKSKCASFHVDGEMVSPVQIVPNPVLLGEHQVGVKAEAVVSIRFPAPDWKVERVETESADTGVTLAETNDGLVSYRIVHTIAKPNDESVQLRFVCRKPGGQVETVTASIISFGLPRKRAVQ